MKQLLQKDLNDAIGKVVMMISRDRDDNITSSWVCKLNDYLVTDKPFAIKDVDEPFSSDMRPLSFQIIDRVYIEDEVASSDPWDYGISEVQDEVYLLEESDKEYKLYMNYLNNN